MRGIPLLGTKQILTVLEIISLIDSDKKEWGKVWKKWWANSYTLYSLIKLLIIDLFNMFMHSSSQK